MKRWAFITLGDDVPPAARVQQPAAKLRILVASVGRHQGPASTGAESQRAVWTSGLLA